MRQHGSKGQVKMDPAGGTATEVVGALNSWSLSMERDKEDVTCFGDKTKQYALGLPDVQGELGGVFDDAITPAFIRACLGDTPVMLELIPTTLAPDIFFRGLALLSVEIECAADGAVTITGPFVGAGDWTMEPPAVPLSAAA